MENFKSYKEIRELADILEKTSKGKHSFITIMKEHNQLSKGWNGRQYSRTLFKNYKISDFSIKQLVNGDFKEFEIKEFKEYGIKCLVPVKSDVYNFTYRSYKVYGNMVICLKNNLGEYVALDGLLQVIVSTIITDLKVCGIIDDLVIGGGKSIKNEDRPKYIEDALKQVMEIFEKYHGN